MNRYSTLFCLLLATPATFAQNTYFTPIDAAPLNINPAFTGMFNGSTRISSIYQNRQNGDIPYYNIGLSVDMPIATGRNGNYFASGMQMIRDQAINGDFANFSGLISFSYHKRFGKSSSNKNSDLAVGLQGEYRQCIFDAVHPYFGFQSYNPYMPVPPYHLGIGNSVSYYTLNTGISFSHATGRGFSYVIGLSAYSLTKSNDVIEKIQNEEVGIEPAGNLVLGANWDISKRFTLRPFILVRYANNSGLIAGSDIQYTVGKRGRPSFFSNVFAGTYWSYTAEAVVFSAGTSFKGIRLGIGYNYSYSTFSASGLTGMQIHLQYIAPGSKSPKHKRVIPCNRF